jgi:hypothetical protein
MGRNGTGYVRSRRGSRPLGSSARCDRVPSARVRANCSSSDGGKKESVGDLVSFFGVGHFIRERLTTRV